MTASVLDDRRAQRAIAAGERAKAEAEAEGRYLHNELLALDVDDRRRRSAEAEFDRKRARKAEDKAAKRARWAALAARCPGWLLNALWVTVIVAPIALAWDAQQDFAYHTLQMGGFAWLFPLAVEAGAWVCAFEAHMRGRRGAPVGALIAWMWTLAGVAAVINAAHGLKDHGRIGLVLSVLSLLGVVLHHIRMSSDRAHATGMSAELVRRRVLRWLMYPSMSLRAAAIRARMNVDVERAWELSWLDRYGCGPDELKPRRDIAEAMLARESERALEAANAGELDMWNSPLRAGVLDLDQIALALATYVDSIPARSTLAPGEQHKQGGLSARASELLPVVSAAIGRGELSERPSQNQLARYIRRMGGTCGMPVAKELADHLTGMRSVAGVSA